MIPRASSIHAGLVLCLLGWLPGCGTPAKAAEQKPIPVRVQPVQQNVAGSITRYSGSLEPVAKVTMSFRVNGFVEEVGETKIGGQRRLLDKGDFVRKGTVLARVRVSDYGHKVSVARAQVSEAQAQAELAREDLRRARRLFDAGAITRAELDATVAKAGAADAQVDGAKARLGEAGVALSDTVLRAPMDGVLLDRSVEVGTLVAPGQAAFTVADTRTLRAVFGAPQALVERLRVGDPVRVFVGAETEAKTPEKLIDAAVTRIAAAADTTGRVFSVEAELDNRDGALRAGSVVAVHVEEPNSRVGSMLVPLRAVIRSPRETHGFSVFVLDGNGERGVARLRDVRLGEVTGNDVTVREGLSAGQRVVTVGHTLLRDGSNAVVIR